MSPRNHNHQMTVGTDVAKRTSLSYISSTDSCTNLNRVISLVADIQKNCHGQERNGEITNTFAGSGTRPSSETN